MVPAALRPAGMEDEIRGTIELIGPRQVMIGFQTESDDFSVLELLGGYPPYMWDVISGKLYTLGGEEVRNITQGEI